MNFKEKEGYKLNEGFGILGHQPLKKKSTSPDWKGELMFQGKKIKFAGWNKKSQYGDYISLSIDRQQMDTGPKEVKEVYNDEIPF